MEDKKLAQLAELMQYRRINNEYDAVMELLRPDISTSKKTIIDQYGNKSQVPTAYKELASKSLATGNLDKDGKFFVDETSLIALTLQYITESSDGLIPLLEAHEFFASLQGIETQSSKAVKGKFAELIRTNITDSRTRNIYGGLEALTDKKKMQPLPTEQNFQ